MIVGDPGVEFRDLRVSTAGSHDPGVEIGDLRISTAGLHNPGVEIRVL